MAQGTSKNLKGQQLSVNSAPVVLPSDQIVPVNVVNNLTLGTPDGVPVQLILSSSTGDAIDTRGNSLSTYVVNQAQAPDGSLPVSGSYVDIPIYAQALNKNGFVVDCTGYTTAYVQLNGVWVATGTFQVSSDGLTWSSATVYKQNTGSVSAAVTAVGLFEIPIKSKWLRLSVTAFTSGIITGTVRLSAISSSPTNTAVGTNAATADGVAALSVTPTDSAGTVGMLTTQALIYNGTTHDRPREAVNAANTTGTGIAAVSPLLQFDDVSPTAITENQFGNARMSSNRNAYETIRDASGNERGVNVTLENQILTQDNALRNTEGDIQILLQQLIDLYTATPNMQFALDPNTSRTISVLGTSTDKLDYANITITASTAETTLYTAPPGRLAHLRSLKITNTSASTVCRIDLRNATAGSVVDTTQTVGGTPSNGIAMGGAIIIPQTTRGASWTVTCGTSTTDIRVSATFEIQ